MLMAHSPALAAEACLAATAAPPPGPDPLVAASLHGRAVLDQLVAAALLPFSKTLQSLGPDQRAIRLWFLRYGKGGEQLKLRIHAPARLDREIRRALERTVLAAWPRLPPAPAEGPPRWLGAPPVDREDESPAAHPDRSLRWTGYRRSSVSLGEAPLKDDDRFVSLMVDGLAAACERVLELFAQAGPALPAGKQNLLLSLLVEALAGFGFPAETRRRYLLYHRDSLFRFLLVDNDDPAARAQELLARCEAHAAMVRDPAGSLARLLAESWNASPEGSPIGPLDGSAPSRWQAACAALGGWLSAAAPPLRRRLDPFAWDWRFVPVFKLLHGAANQLGTTSLNEGQLCHLLLARSGAQRPALQFLPDWEWADD